MTTASLQSKEDVIKHLLERRNITFKDLGAIKRHDPCLQLEPYDLTVIPKNIPLVIAIRNFNKIDNLNMFFITIESATGENLTLYRHDGNLSLFIPKTAARLTMDCLQESPGNPIIHVGKIISKGRNMADELARPIEMSHVWGAGRLPKKNSQRFIFYPTDLKE